MVSRYSNIWLNMRVSLIQAVLVSDCDTVNCKQIHNVDFHNRITSTLVSIHCRIQDEGGRDAPPNLSVQFLSCSYNFREKFGDTIGWHSHLWRLAPTLHGKYWIRHCNQFAQNIRLRILKSGKYLCIFLNIIISLEFITGCYTCFIVQ